MQFDKEGGIGKYEIEQFLNELGSCPPVDKIEEMIARFDGDGMFNKQFPNQQLPIQSQ